MKTLPGCLLALVLALLASEGVLRCFMPDPTVFAGMNRPVGITMPDARLAWRFIPGQEVAVRVAGRTISYAFDRDGNRAASSSERADPDKASMLFCGESIMAGWGLAWEESIPALLAARTGLQAINLAVFGYGNDQALRRLEEALPRFTRVRAVVSLVNPLQLERNLRAWQPGFALDGEGKLTDRSPVRGFFAHFRLGLVWNQLPFHRKARIRLTAAIFARTAAYIRAAGAIPIFILPSYGPPRKHAQHAEVALFDQLFKGLDYVIVDLDPRLRQRDPLNAWHPTPEGARVIAEAILEALGRDQAMR